MHPGHFCNKMLGRDCIAKKCWPIKQWHEFSIPLFMKEKTTYQRIEQWFEGLVGIALKIYGHPFTFVVALLLVIFFLVQSVKNSTHLQDLVRDIILSISFLSFFIIQRAVNKTTTAIRIKINELIASQDKASNDLLAIEEKTGSELEELADEHKAKVSKTTEKNAS
jgi:low affinity Fe/Cu permease